MIQLRFCLGTGGNARAELSLALAAFRLPRRQISSTVAFTASYAKAAAALSALPAASPPKSFKRPERAAPAGARIQVFFRRARRCVTTPWRPVRVESTRAPQAAPSVCRRSAHPVDVNVLHLYHAHADVPHFFAIAPHAARGRGWPRRPAAAIRSVFQERGNVAPAKGRSARPR